MLTRSPLPAVFLRKLSDEEQPLRLRLLAGPSEKALSFVLKENDSGEVNVSTGTVWGRALWGTVPLSCPVPGALCPAVGRLHPARAAQLPAHPAA